MQRFVALERGLEELDLAVALDALALRVSAGLLVAVGLVELGHLVDALFVLHLNLELVL